MGEILLTGNIGIVTNNFIEHLMWEERVIICGDIPVKEYKSRKAVPYTFREDDNEYRGLFKSYDLETVVYFSRVLDGQKRIQDEIERLENSLYCSRMSQVKQFIYVTTNDYVEEEAAGTRTRLLRTCEDICRSFGEDSGMNVTLLRIPYLFSAERTGSYVQKALNKARDEKELELAGWRIDETDFISDEDLAQLLSRIMDEPVGGFCEANIGGGNRMAFSELADKISELYTDIHVSYRDYTEAVPKALNDGKMRELYGWYPVVYLEDTLKQMTAAAGREEREEKRRRVRLIRSEKARQAVLAVVEMGILFVIAEFLTRVTYSYARIDYVDFRLLFVIIIGTVHGTGAGIAASLLAAAGYFSREISGANLQILFFNIENWLPFAAYFLSGTIVGHIRDKNRETVRFMKEQLDILENKYVFLNELYGKTLENKEEYSKQIIGYQDSFGKIYQVVRKLNSTVLDNIFCEAITAMEETLGVTSVSIYSVKEDSSFARLNMCSREINGVLARSLDLGQFPQILEALWQEKGWYNAEGLEGYPVYAAPVFRNGALTGMILLWKVKAEQMKTEFFNKFSIICGLVQDALVRAIEYTEREERMMMIPETRILQTQYFERVIERKSQLRKDGMSEYVLLQLKAAGMEEKQLSDLVTESIRSEDVIGKRKDGKVYLLLTQANPKSIRFVRERLEPKGILVE